MLGSTGTIARLLRLFSHLSYKGDPSNFNGNISLWSIYTYRSSFADILPAGRLGQGGFEWDCPFFAAVNLVRLPSLQNLCIRNQYLKGSLDCQALSSLEITYDPEICKLRDRSKAAADTFANLAGLQKLCLRLIRPALQVGSKCCSCPQVELFTLNVLVST